MPRIIVRCSRTYHRWYTYCKVYHVYNKIQHMMKTVIIPDIHNKFSKAEDIICKENPDKVVFLGDYFDDFRDDVYAAKKTAEWLVWSLGHQNRTHLIGNHDLQYMSNDQRCRCTGYASDKHDAIKKYKIDWSKLCLYLWVGGNNVWLCTHAGLSNTFFVYMCRDSGMCKIQDVLEQSKKDFVHIDNKQVHKPFFQVGEARGGLKGEVGGVIWCDYNYEFVDIPSIKQIFGHTRDSTVRHNITKEGAEHYCIDTVLRNYAVYQDDKLIIKTA